MLSFVCIDLFGEHVLLGEHPVSNGFADSTHGCDVSCIALSRCELFRLSRDDLLFLVTEKFPEVRDDVADYALDTLIKHKRERCFSLLMSLSAVDSATNSSVHEEGWPSVLPATCASGSSSGGSSSARANGCARDHGCSGSAGGSSCGAKSCSADDSVYANESLEASADELKAGDWGRGVHGAALRIQLAVFRKQKRLLRSTSARDVMPMFFERIPAINRADSSAYPVLPHAHSGSAASPPKRLGPAKDESPYMPLRGAERAIARCGGANAYTAAYTSTAPLMSAAPVALTTPVMYEMEKMEKMERRFEDKFASMDVHLTALREAMDDNTIALGMLLRRDELHAHPLPSPPLPLPPARPPQVPPLAPTLAPSPALPPLAVLAQNPPAQLLPTGYIADAHEYDA